MNIALIPSASIFLNNHFFSPSYSRDNVLEPFSLLKNSLNQKNIRLDTYDLYDDLSIIDLVIIFRFEYNIDIILKLVKRNPIVKIIFIVTEEQNIAPTYTKEILINHIFDCVLTWRDDLVNNKYFFKYFYPNPLRIMIEPIPYTKKKYISIINSNKKHNINKIGDLYIERLKAIHYFAQNSEIDLFGMGWDKSKDPHVKKAYLGPVDSKIETLKNYKYAIAFENSNNEIGGICEKIFDVMAAGCVPIYWGAPNVLEYIPKDTFIDYRDFMDYKKLDDYLKSINKERYAEYLSSIGKFLSSDEYLQFTSIGFIDTVTRVIDHVSNLPPTKKSIASIKWEFIKKMFSHPKIFWHSKGFVLDLLK